MSTTPEARGGDSAATSVAASDARTDPVDERADSPSQPGPDEGRSPSSGPWFPAIDGLRGLAALVVTIYHVAGTAGAWRDLWWGKGVIRFGNVGVALFFVLSGFLISRSFFVAYLEGRPAPTIFRYIVRRIARIVPAYWVALTVWLFFIRDAPPVGGFWAYPILYGFAQGYWREFVDRGGAMAVAWTLSIEMTFYILMPAVAWLMCRAADQARTLRGRVNVLAAISLALWIGGSLLRWRLLSGSRTEAFVGYTIAGHFGWFAAGLALAAVAAGVSAGVQPARWVRDLAREPALCLGLAAGVFWLTTLLPFPAPGFGVQTAWESLLLFCGNGLVGALCVLPMVIGDQSLGRLRAAFSGRVARWLGEISYGLYLWHTLVLAVVMEWIRDEAMSPALLPRFAVVIVVSLALAQVSWVVVEQPCMRLVDRLLGRR